MAGLVVTVLIVAGQHLFLSGRSWMVVKDSLEGAVRRLERPECQEIFGVFTDGAGHRLSDDLAMSGQRAADALVALYFVAADSLPQCRTNEATATFTQPYGRLVYVCTERFVNSFARRTAGGELLLIHELMHTLGLGENPPSSAQISEAVMRYCGG